VSGPDRPPLRVAVASSDGLHVDQHLGRAERLCIFAAVPGAPLLEQRRMAAVPDSPGHDAGRLAGILALLDGCAAVLALQVGPAFRQELERRGIRVLTGEGPIAPLLERIGASYLGRGPRQRLKPAGTPTARTGS
jgi:predicted Fe-Mo cluster-binding NifX family protein